jgi:acyl-CoA thioester hydrolase
MKQHYNTKINIAIDWADLDLFGHVNNVTFFKYIQSARVNYCELIGLTALNNTDKLSFMVASSQCQFKKPLLYPNKIFVSCKTTWIKNSSFQLNYLITLEDGTLIAEAEDVLVVFNHQQKIKAMLNEEIRLRIKTIDAA